MGVVGASLRKYYTKICKYFYPTIFFYLLMIFFSARPGRKNSGTPITPDSARSTGRSRSRLGSMGGSGAVSQPGSRSTSPSSIKSYHTYFDPANVQVKS